MLTGIDLKKIFHRLIRQFSIKVWCYGSDITINFCEHASKVQMSTPVYLGSNYIPKSVRECIKNPGYLNSHLKTYFMVDEANFRVILNYGSAISRYEDEIFESMIEEFCSCANEWRIIFDDKDKNDLIYVPAKN